MLVVHFDVKFKLLVVLLLFVFIQALGSTQVWAELDPPVEPKGEAGYEVVDGRLLVTWDGLEGPVKVVQDGTTVADPAQGTTSVELTPPEAGSSVVTVCEIPPGEIEYCTPEIRIPPINGTNSESTASLEAIPGPGSITLVWSGLDGGSQVKIVRYLVSSEDGTTVDGYGAIENSGSLVLEGVAPGETFIYEVCLVEGLPCTNRVEAVAGPTPTATDQFSLVVAVVGVVVALVGVAAGVIVSRR